MQSEDQKSQMAHHCQCLTPEIPGVSLLPLNGMLVHRRLPPAFYSIVIHLHLLFMYLLGGLDIVCKAIVTGQATSLDHASHGLLSVMQELTNRSSRKELSRSLTAITENDWTKRMTNFAPYGQCKKFMLVHLYIVKNGLHFGHKLTILCALCTQTKLP